MSSFREAVMDAMDDFYEQSDGMVPQHIIVSERKYSGLRVEKLGRGKGETQYYPTSGEGYIGMVLWHSDALDNTPVDALLLTDKMMHSLFSQSKDF